MYLLKMKRYKNLVFNIDHAIYYYHLILWVVLGWSLMMTNTESCNYICRFTGQVFTFLQVSSITNSGMKQNNLLTCVGEALSFGKFIFPGLSCKVEGLQGVGGSLLPWPLLPPSIGWLCWTLLWWAALCCIGIPTTAPAVNVYLIVLNIWFFTMIT